ncbi:unnamed protein product [Discosporangium mesarthrocarpum]
MIPGHVTCLLGHNGAGKSTTVSMLTGQLPPTAGDCFVWGKSVRHDLNKVRQDMGICPQHDALLPLLTAREHLEMYMDIKGVDPTLKRRLVSRKLREVGLLEKEHTLASDLSGGQKRKLSVAIAFTGSPRLCVLDEPTSGMDPYSRRYTWELIRRSRRGRCVLLTTHFMDEAEYLGDRVAMLSCGRLRCVGSPLFLKSRFGLGYNLTLVKATEGFDAAALANLVQTHVPSADQLSAAGGEVTYRLPRRFSSQFPGLFRELEERREAFGVGGYGVSVTTLEEVFLSLEKEAGGEEEEHGEREVAGDRPVGPGVGSGGLFTPASNGGWTSWGNFLLRRPWGYVDRLFGGALRRGWLGRYSGAGGMGVRSVGKEGGPWEWERERGDPSLSGERGEGNAIEMTSHPYRAWGGAREDDEDRVRLVGTPNKTEGGPADSAEGNLRAAGGVEASGSAEVVGASGAGIHAANTEGWEDNDRDCSSNPCAGLCSQILWLLWKRRILARRDWRGGVFQVCLPAGLVVLILFLLTLGNNLSGPSAVMSAKQFPQETEAMREGGRDDLGGVSYSGVADGVGEWARVDAESSGLTEATSSGMSQLLLDVHTVSRAETDNPQTSSDGQKPSGAGIAPALDTGSVGTATPSRLPRFGAFVFGDIITVDVTVDWPEVQAHPDSAAATLSALANTANKACSQAPQGSSGCYIDLAQLQVCALGLQGGINTTQANATQNALSNAGPSDTLAGVLSPYLGSDSPLLSGQGAPLLSNASVRFSSVSFDPSIQSFRMEDVKLSTQDGTVGLGDLAVRADDVLGSLPKEQRKYEGNIGRGGGGEGGEGGGTVVNTVMFNTTAPHALPAWVGELTAKTYQACGVAAGWDGQINYTTRNHPLPFTSAEARTSL